jgi:hypothetical protein
MISFVIRETGPVSDNYVPSFIQRVATVGREGMLSAKREVYVLEFYVNLLKPTGYVMHHQFNIQQFYVLPTLYLGVLYLSNNEQRLVPLTT